MSSRNTGTGFSSVRTRQMSQSDFKEGKMKRRYEEDPVLGDENDLDNKNELFETFKSMGWQPEHLKNKKDQAEYRKWLKLKGNRH